MATRDEIWVIGTDPPCPRCDLLAQMAHELVNELDLPIMIRHLAYTDDVARQFAGSLGLEPGTAKDVAKKAGIEMDWDEVYRIIDAPGAPAGQPSDPSCCPGRPGAKWTPALDLALRPCEERALSVGIMMTPVLVMAGRICHQGSVPPRGLVRQWIEEAFSREAGKKGGAITVEVLGPGCHNCDTVYQNVFKALDMAGLRDRVHVKKIADLDYFMKRGVHVTPGLVIDGRVVSKGKVLKPEQIVEILNANIIELQPPKMRLPRLVEADPRGPEVLRVLNTRTRPLWSSGVEVPTVELSSELAEALRSAERSGRVIRGLEGAERALAAEERGLRAAQGAGRLDVRISRLLLLADDGSERFYRHVETLLRLHGPRVLAVRLDADAHALGERLFGPGRLARLLMIVHKEAVSTLLLAMAGQGVPAEGGPDGRE